MLSNEQSSELSDKVRSLVLKGRYIIERCLAKSRLERDPRKLISSAFENSTSIGNKSADIRLLVLFSGGIDSTVALYLAKAMSKDILALELDYYQRPDAEKARVASILEAAGIQSIKLGAPTVTSSTSHQIEALVPETNALTYSLAAGIAQKLGYNAVVGGQIRDDWSDGKLPQAEPSQFGRLNTSLKQELGDERPVLSMPFLHLTKSEVVRLGVKLGAPLGLTWSCENNGDAECATCPQCVLKAEAYKAEGVNLNG
jgi:7-cyano-7-deazaguanine synthase